VVVAVDSTRDQEKCSKRFAQVVKRNVKFLSNRAVTGQFIARNAFPNAKKAGVDLTLRIKKEDGLIVIQSCKTAPDTIPAE
jgi:hypothetical protein